jgi:hypothetical protein
MGVESFFFVASGFGFPKIHSPSLYIVAYPILPTFFLPQVLDFCLVGGIPTPLKNLKVRWADDIPNRWKNMLCSKPPASLYIVAYPIGPT